MKPPAYRSGSSEGSGHSQRSVTDFEQRSRLLRWVVGLAAAIFALVPLAFNPLLASGVLQQAFYLFKFTWLMALSLALALALAGAMSSGSRFVKVPVLVPALLFLGISALSTLFSGNVVHSLIGEWRRHDGLLSLAAGVLLFYTAARFLESWSQVRFYLASGVVSAVLISVYGILQQFGLDPVTRWVEVWPAGPDRVFSTIAQPVHLAAYCTLMMGAALALYFLTEAHWERRFWLLALGLIGACWLYTYTRGAMLGVGAALLAILFLAHRRLGSIRPLFLPIAVVVAAMLAAQLLSPQFMYVFDRFAAANLAFEPENVPQNADTNVVQRLLVWRDTVPMILERPLLGHGPDNFRKPFEDHQGEDLAAFIPAGVYYDKAHNEFLQVAATTGLLGLAAYLWIFVSYFRNAYRSGGWPLLSLSGGVLAYILQLQTAFTTIAVGVTFWAILGVSVAVMRIQEAESRATGGHL